MTPDQTGALIAGLMLGGILGACIHRWGHKLRRRRQHRHRAHRIHIEAQP